MIDGISLSTRKFNDILDEQVTIALLSKGAITVSETNEMPPSDRRRILNMLMEIEQRNAEQLQKLRK